MPVSGDSRCTSIDTNSPVLQPTLLSSTHLMPKHSYLAILRPTDAVPDLKKALSFEPNNKAIRDQLQMTVKLIRRIEFEKVSCLGILKHGEQPEP